MSVFNPPARDSVVLTRREERRVLVVTCLAAFLFFNSFGSISVALPTIQKQFGSSLAEIQWVSLMGVVTISSLSLCFGKAGDLLGRRRIFKIGVALYTLGSGLGSLSGSFVQLLFARGVMAIGLSMAVPMSAAIIASSFTPDRRGQALGIFAAAVAVGRAAGPTIGGLLLYLWDWPAIFTMNFLVGLGVSCAVCRIFRGPGERQAGTLDIWGSVSVLIGYPALLIGFTLAANSGWQWNRFGWWFVVAAVALLGFVWVELKTASPLVDFRMLRRGSLSAALLSNLLITALYNPITICGPLYLHHVLSASPLAIGIILSLLPITTALTSPLSGRASDRMGTVRLVVAGLGLISLGVFVYSRLGAESGFLPVALALGLVGMGVGIFTPANQKAAFSCVESEDYGVLSALLSSFTTAAGTLGTTAIVALLELKIAGLDSHDPWVFASAQQFAFSWSLPLGILAMIVAFTPERKSRSLLGSSG